MADVVAVKFDDDNTDTGGRIVYLPIPSGKPDADVLAIAQEFQERSDRMSDGVIVDCYVKKQLALLPKTGSPGAGQIKDVAVTDSQINHGGLLSMTNDGPSRHPFWIPAWTLALYVGNALDITDTIVTDFTTFLTVAATYGGSSFQPITLHGDNFLAIGSSGRSHRK